MLKPFENISPADFTYDLPNERIAMFPAPLRDRSKLLIHDAKGQVSEDVFTNIAQHLPGGKYLFFNNSKVIPARLIFSMPGGSRIEIFCLRPLDPSDYGLSLSSFNSCIWECMVGNIRKFRGEAIQLVPETSNFTLTAGKLEAKGNIARIRFSWDNDALTFAQILSQAGQTPLPPYIKRLPVAEDRQRYQTIYSRSEGSVAAPTAGLHFTEPVLKSLTKKNILCHEVTLHVGAGTFQPVKASFMRDHEMHSEFFEVSHSLVTTLCNLNRRAICVGTTTVRTLESLYWLGVKLLQGLPDENTLQLGQWEAYSLPANVSVQEAFGALDQWFTKNKISQTLASTSLLIVPGYQFRMADVLVTNFHQPGSTLLLLIAAFIGDSWRKAYDYALSHGFRFLSYGDSSVLYSRDYSD